jgi:hypothetical protein
VGREEIVVKDQMPMQACMLSQAALADWKAHSIYAGEQWAIGRIKCVPVTTSSRGRSDASQPSITACAPPRSLAAHDAIRVAMIVRCIDNILQRDVLEIGREYEVRAERDDCYIRSGFDKGFRKTRFEIVSRCGGHQHPLR